MADAFAIASPSHNPDGADVIELVDTHCHLDLEEFDADRNEVIARAGEAGLTSMVTMGIDLASSRQAIALSGRHATVFAAVGIHPNSCGEASADDWSQIEALAREPGVVAIGESGLDFYRDYAPADLQEDYFDRHIRLAARLKMPFIVHMRESDQRIVEMLREAAARGPLSGIMHSFTGTAELAAECVALGMHVSFAGMVTFKKSQEIREVAATIPADRLLVETDSPYLSPHPLRGRRNEPAHVVHTAACLAEVRNASIEEIAQQTTANARRLFNLPG